MIKYITLVFLFISNIAISSAPVGSFTFTITDQNSGIEYPAYISVNNFISDYWIEARYLNSPDDDEYTYIAGPDIPEGDQYYSTEEDVKNIVDSALMDINNEIEDIFGIQDQGGDIGWLDKVKFYIRNSLQESNNVITSK